MSDQEICVSTVNNSCSDERPSLDHTKRCLEARMEQLARGDIHLALFDGMDSSPFPKTATDAATHTGRNVYAVTFDSRLHPFCDLEIARRVVGESEGIHGVTIVDELEQEATKNNLVNRCYLCKRYLLSELAELTQARGIRYILGSTNGDNIHVYRPEIQVLKELGITSPLTKLRITKARVEALASEYGISVASRLSTPCITTRLPYGTVLDYEVLGRIGAGEAYARTMVPGNVCLRLHGDIARLGPDLEAFDVFMKCWKETVSRLKEMEFVYITLGAEEFRSGSVGMGLTGLG